MIKYEDFVLQKYGNDKLKILNNVIKTLCDFKFSYVSLPSSTPSQMVIETFERINKNNYPLSVFDLFVAKKYDENQNYRQLWNDMRDEFPLFKEYKVSDDWLLRIVCLIRGKFVKKSTILDLDKENLSDHFFEAGIYLNDAIKFSKDNFGFYDSSKVPYKVILIPMAALFFYFKEHNLQSYTTNLNIKKWYWNSLFFERYESATDHVAYRDYLDLIKFFQTNNRPHFLDSSISYIENIDLDKKPATALFKAVMSMLVANKIKDFTTAELITFDPINIQTDHIIPKKFDSNPYDYIANRTLTTSNSYKGHSNPKDFFEHLEEKHDGKENLMAILKTHLIDEQCYNYLIEGNKEKFIETRTKVIQNKMHETILSPP